jgi:protein-disulfide isomerase
MASLDPSNGLDLLPIRDNDHVKGPADTPVTLVEFGDYECPGCAEAYGTIQRIHEELQDRLRFVFRHYAYARLHPHAELAAQAAEAAGVQGKFWEMHDLLFRDQEHLELRDLVSRAKRLDLDLETFTEDLKSERYLDRVRDDFKTGVQNGVFGTPALFINGIRHNAAPDYETLMQALEQPLVESPR